jgi:replicative DNA helicase
MGGQKVENAPFDKVPPQNLEAEQAVLGAMLLNENVVPDVVDFLDKSVFYKDAHQEIYGVISELYNRRRNVDIVTVVEELRKRQLLERVGGAVYVNRLVDNVPSAANALAYARIVREKGILRALINASLDILNRCYQDEDVLEELLDTAEKSIFNVCGKQAQEQHVPIREIVHDTIEIIEQLYQNKSSVTGIPTGYPELDKMTSGLHGGELIILAARPSMGKTAFAMNLAEHAAIDKKAAVLFFSIEMSKESVTQRFLCTRARVDAHKVRTGALSPQDDWPRLTSAAAQLSDSPLFIDDMTSNIFDIRAKARRMKAQHDIRMIIVDYLQLIRTTGKRIESRQMEITEISTSLKALSKELNVPVIALSQLSREVEKREDHRPRLSDLRESGAIEQDADLVVLLYRDEYYNPDNPETQGTAEVILAKQRNGPTGAVRLGFIKEYMKFVAIDSVHVDQAD